MTRAVEQLLRLNDKLDFSNSARTEFHIPLQLFVRFGQIFFGVSPDVYVGGSFPFPGGWLLGGLLLANLLAAHLVRFKLSWKRSGITRL